MKKVRIGQNLWLDVMRLVETRLILEASSGGGKSMTCRTLLENTFGLIPHIVLDVEGEFSTLREKYDYILAGKGGDIPVSVGTAQMLARKILELNASIIIDLSELKEREKHRFVRLFLEALVDAPKELWGPRLVVIDEGHKFCPEKGAGVSEASEAVIDVCSRGRKRGLCPILATQRPAKLSKDATAECQNKIIGLANIEIDRKRAAEELGFTKKEDILSLRDMEAGEFYFIGPAICKTVQKGKIDIAKTSHPKIGKRAVKAPVATHKVRGLLEKLKDLPQEAETELKNVVDLKAKIRDLEAKLKTVQVIKPVADLSEVELKRVRAEYQKQLNKLTEEFDKRRIFEMTQAMRKIQQRLHEAIEGVTKEYAGKTEVPVMTMTTHPKPEEIKPKTLHALRDMALQTAALKTPVYIDGEKKLEACEKAILKYAQRSEEKVYSKIQLAIGANYMPTSSSFKNALGAVISNGFLMKVGVGYQIRDFEKVIKAVGVGLHKNTPSEHFLKVFMAEKLGKCEVEIMEVLIADRSHYIPKSDIALNTPSNYSITSSSFKNAVGHVVSLEMATKAIDGTIKVNDEILDL